MTDFQISTALVASLASKRASPASSNFLAARSSTMEPRTADPDSSVAAGCCAANGRQILRSITAERDLTIRRRLSSILPAEAAPSDECNWTKLRTLRRRLQCCFRVDAADFQQSLALAV